MVEVQRDGYVLLLGKCPCDIFIHYGVEEMHGLSLSACKEYNNTSQDGYIWGLSNYIPKQNGEYNTGDNRFVFINLQRCGKNYETFGCVFHELMHHSLDSHYYNMSLEESIITWAEIESHKVFNIIIENI